MGLDMYAYAVANNPANTELSIAEGVEREDIAYWRKFNALHGWMQQLFERRGGTGDFNCQPLRLHKADLFNLQQDIILNRLTPCQGFFFGTQEIYPEDIEATYTFIGKALTALNAGQEVYYDSWW